MIFSKNIICTEDNEMSRGRRSSIDDGAIAFVAYLMMAAVVIPILGIYWTFWGKSENKRIIGIAILVLCAFFSICSMVS